MPKNTIEELHMHKRKRIYQKYEKYPHPNKYKRLLDKIMYPVGLLGPAMMAPQIIKIYVEKDASSIALTSWVLFLVTTSVWLLYGFAHKERIIIISSFGWIVAYLFMVAGVIIY